MKGKTVHLFLEQSLFDETHHAASSLDGSTLCGNNNNINSNNNNNNNNNNNSNNNNNNNAGMEFDHTLLPQQTRFTSVQLGDKYDRRTRVMDFFLLQPHQQSMELANALLRQFVFRAYKKRAPDIIPAFNIAFPRTLHSITSKSLVRALLDEMGITEGRGLAEVITLEDNEMEHSSFSHSATNRQVSQLLTNNEYELEDTVLEQLVRHVLRQFHARHPGRYQCTNGDSSVDSNANTNTSGSRVSQMRCRYESNNNNNIKKSNDSGLTFTDQASPLNVSREHTSSALRSFFTEHPTEDDQVFAVAAALLRQHVSHPYLVPISPAFGNDSTTSMTMVNEKDSVGSTSEQQAPPTYGFAHIINFDCSTCDYRNDEVMRTSSDRILLMDLLKNVQQTTISCRTLAALLGENLSSSCPLSREAYVEGISITSMTLNQSSVTSSDFPLCDNVYTVKSGNENSDVYDNSTSRERRRQVVSLLCLYLLSRIQKGLPPADDVYKRMIRFEREQTQMNTASMSLRDSSSNIIFSPLSFPAQASLSTPNIQHLTISQPHIIAVDSIENMTRIGRGSSGELFAIPRLDTGELVAVKRIYITEHSRKHVENELSVLRRNILFDHNNKSNNNNNNSNRKSYSRREGNSNTKSPISTTEHTDIEEDTEHSPDDITENSDNDDARAVVRCYDMFIEGGCAFIVMELMDSGSFIDALKARHGRGFSEIECCAITFQVLHGLRYLHDTIRQLHRDLKPHNILLNRSTGEVKLTDFGLSSNQLQSMGFDQCGTFVGTLAYMSPERVDADSVYGRESDFWSLGITLLQLALGKLPFTPTIFTIAAFRTQPPRLPVLSFSYDDDDDDDDEEDDDKEEEYDYDDDDRNSNNDNHNNNGNHNHNHHHHVRYNESDTSESLRRDSNKNININNNMNMNSALSTSRVFSAAFQDFVAALMPAVHKGRERLTSDTNSDCDDSVRSCAHTFSQLRHAGVFSSHTGQEEDEDYDDINNSNSSSDNDIIIIPIINSNSNNGNVKGEEEDDDDEDENSGNGSERRMCSTNTTTANYDNNDDSFINNNNNNNNNNNGNGRMAFKRRPVIPAIVHCNTIDVFNSASLLTRHDFLCAVTPPQTQEKTEKEKGKEIKRETEEESESPIEKEKEEETESAIEIEEVPLLSSPISSSSSSLLFMQERVELTATALLQHPWLRNMTWEKSAAIVSQISLEPTSPQGKNNQTNINIINMNNSNNINNNNSNNSKNNKKGVVEEVKAMEKARLNEYRDPGKCSCRSTEMQSESFGR